MSELNPRADRLFVPLASEPFYWFESGRKKWELRRVGRRFTERNVFRGRKVELRRGYSAGQGTLWGTVREVLVADSIESFFALVPFDQVVPVAFDRDDAISMAASILGAPADSAPVIGFLVEIDQMNRRDVPKTISFGLASVFAVSACASTQSPNPDSPSTSPTQPASTQSSAPVIALSAEYVQLVRDGKKVTTVRKGRRSYAVGPAVLKANTVELAIDITRVEYRAFKELTDEDARSDGFATLDELKSALKKFYPDLKPHDPVTILHFTVRN